MSWLEGKSLAARLRAEAARGAQELGQGKRPRLAVVLATEDGGAQWYSRSIVKAAGNEGLEAELVDESATASLAELAETIKRLGADPSIHGIILQAPLPEGVEVEALAELIPSTKDIDGMNPESTGRLVKGQIAFAPATAEAVLRLLDDAQVDLAGRRVVVVGRSAVVGRPAAELLLARDATVTVCHSKTRDLARVTGRAEILVVAIGRAQMINSDYVADGAVVIDVGTNVDEDGALVGDVDPSVIDKASLLTPVPGGVGPVTTALLLLHTVQAARGQLGLERQAS